MIKINLLPTKRPGKVFTIKLDFKSNIVYLLIAIGVVILLEGYAWYWLNSKISTLTEEKQVLDVRLRDTKEKVKEVENYEKDKKTHENKIVIIQNLKKSQRGPVRVLDEISRTLPDRVWLVSLKVKGDTISISGSGMTNDDIVKYISNLKTSMLFKNVRLIESRQVVDSGIPVYSFRLSFNLNLEVV